MSSRSSPGVAELTDTPGSSTKPETRAPARMKNEYMQLLMRLEHVALWTEDLERLSNFYSAYFGAIAGPRYINQTDRFGRVARLLKQLANHGIGRNLLVILDQSGGKLE